MPFLTSAGLGLYALLPTLFPQYAFWGLLAGTVLFSMAAGLNEVLMSPIVAKLVQQEKLEGDFRYVSLARGFLG